MDGRVEFQADELLAALAEAGRRAADLTPLMDDIGGELLRAAQRRISDTNVSPDGVPWPASFRVTAGQGGKTLYHYGGLRDSIVAAAGPREAEIGSNLIYAAIHQFGGEIRPKSADALVFKLADGTVVTAGKVTIPARPYLGVAPEDEVVLLDLVRHYFEEAAGDVV